MHSNSTNYDAMNPDGAADAPDQRFLDEVFERAVQLVEEGLVPETEALLAGHEALRAEVDRLVQLARHVAVGAAAPLPALAGFTILQQLGQGGMGMVYLARQHSLGGRPVALKVLPNSAALSTRARARFLAEAMAIARLRHPNIVAVHDVVHQGDVYAYAMEWVDGSSLADVIAREGTEALRHEGTKGLGIPSVCQIGLSIARALEAVHTAGLLHRDVKPSNILLRRDGTPLLADFGLARELDSSVHTQAGHFAGTVAYAPPEQLRGDSPPPAGRGQGGGRQGDGSGVDTRSDIYALGVTLYHALALRLPFEGRNPTAMLRRIEAGAATPLRKLNPRVPRDLETIVAKAIEADPARRYQTAGELADDLERFMNYQPIRARPAGMLTRGIKLVRRNRGAALGLTVGSVITLALAAAAVTYVIFLPGWVADHVREARLTLLDPGQATNIVSTIYWGRINPGGNEHWEARRRVLQQALVHYDRALRLTPRDESIRREREVVSRAWQQATEPRIFNSARGQSGHQLPPRPTSTSVPSRAQLPRTLSAASLRDDALYAFLTHDYPTAIEKWSAWEQSRDPLLEPDPLVDAALGVLYLFDDQPARAYPRLQKAAEAFPGVGFILEYLADAAAKCGDVERAERWLHEAQRLRTSAGGGANQRIRASILARQGRDDEAEAIYRSESAPGPVILEHARFLESRGRMDEAVEQYARAAAGMSGDRPAREFVNAADRWWAGLSKPGRLDRIRSTLDGGPESILGLLRHYQSLTTREEPQPRITMRVGYGLNGGGFQISNLKFQILAALCVWISSPPLEGLSLSELAQHLEVENMSLWSRFSTYPRFLKKLQFAAWRSSVLCGVSRIANSIFVAFADERQRRTRLSRLAAMSAAAIALGTIASQSASGQCTTPPCFQGLGDLPGGCYESLAFGMSVDGTVVTGAGTTGSCSVGSQAFRWTATTGLTGLGYLPGDNFSYAYRVSADGSTATGHSKGNSSTERPYFWTQSNGMVQIPYLPGGQVWGRGLAVSSDGAFIVGFSDSTNAPYPRTEAWRYARATGLSESLGDLPGADFYSFAYAVSADGTIAAGISSSASSGPNNWEAFRWTAGSGMEGLGDLLGGAFSSQAFGISGDGDTVVGLGHSASGQEAMRWTQAAGMSGLGDLPGGPFSSYAYGVSMDGSFIVGSGTTAGGQEAFIFHASHAMQRLIDVLLNFGVDVPSGWILRDATAVSESNGVVIVSGYGTNPSGNTEAWIARYTLPTPCTSPPCFQGLGDLPGGVNESYAFNISADGTTVVGRSTSGNGPEAFRWQTNTGMNGLGDLQGAAYYSDGFGVSADGSIVVGRSQSGNGQGTPPLEAFLWTAANGMQGLGDLPGGLFQSSAYNVSADGSLLVGLADQSSGGGDIAATWTAATGWSSLGITPLRNEANDVSPNGQFIVGLAGITTGNVTAWRWSSQTGVENLGDLPGGAPLGVATTVSADGSVVAGFAGSSNGTEAFRWTSATGMIGLGDFPGGEFDSKCTTDGLSQDGTLIVGYGTTAIGQEAAIWDQSLTIARLVDVLTARGVAIPIGWELKNTTGITINSGVVSLCGYGTNPQGNTEAWIARYTLPPACDPADVVQSPDAATAPFGGSVQLQVMAGGTGPITYQWRKNNVNLTDGPVGCGGTISGATTDTLVLNTVTFVEGGNYDCVVTNACGTDTSTAATLTINPPPAAADVNHDGQVNGLDIQALVNALLAP